MDSKTTLQSLAAYVHGANDVDTKVHAAVTLHVIDTIGAWIAGAHSAEGKALLSFRRQMRAQSGAAQSILTDVMTNCAVARLSEIDDIHLASMTTPGAIVIPAALTPISPGVVLASARAAGETAPLIFPALFSAFWPEGIFNPIATMSVLIFNFAIMPYPAQNELAWAASFVLVMMILAANLLARWLSRLSKT